METQLSSSLNSQTFVNRIILGFVFLTPLLPRPTAEGPERFVVPVLMAFVIAVWAFLWPKKMPYGSSGLKTMAVLIGFSLAVFLTRILIGGDFDESDLLISRVLFSVGLLVVTHWLCTTQVAAKTVFRYFLYGYVTVSLLAIFVGITGIQILEADSVKPSRFMGFYKTTGIFRSFGEFGIMGALAWGYLLVFKRDFSTSSWIVLSAIVLASSMISQSRNVYLVISLVTALAMIFSATRIPPFARASLAAMLLLIPFAVDVGLPLLRSTGVGETVIGAEDSILQRNVEYRFDQFAYAFEFLPGDLGKILMGYPREDWREFTVHRVGHAVAPHNYFLSNLIFLGVLGGGVWIIGLFIYPCVLLFQSDLANHPVRVLTGISMLGTIAGLSFYEGFFSIVVLLSIALTWSAAMESGLEKNNPRSRNGY